jgi:hypothetical protein
MSRGQRIALVMTAIVLFLCCVAGLGITLLGTRLVGRAFITNPDRVQSVGREIADYEVLPGYDEMFAMNVMGIKMVAIGPDDPAAGLMIIMLMQFSTGMEISREEMERQMEQALARQTGLGRADMQVVGQEQVTIKGEPVTLTVREGATEDGERMRQVSGLFQGRSGPTMLMVMGEATAWDQPMLDQFMASIR